MFEFSVTKTMVLIWHSHSIKSDLQVDSTEFHSSFRPSPCSHIFMDEGNFLKVHVNDCKMWAQDRMIFNKSYPRQKMFIFKLFSGRVEGGGGL